MSFSTVLVVVLLSLLFSSSSERCVRSMETLAGRRVRGVLLVRRPRGEQLAARPIDNRISSNACREIAVKFHLRHIDRQI